MELDQELKRLSYLWDENEGWELSITYYSLEELTIKFAGQQPTITEIAAVRKLLERFQHVPVKEIKTEIGNSGTLPLGKFESIEAHRIKEKAAQLNLQIISVDASFTSYLPYNSKTKMMSIIEDEDLLKAVVERMMKANRPIIPTEVG
ncbi:MAG: hypothetical protein AB1589_42950 [Cyanobacteriota bacterium]